MNGCEVQHNNPDIDSDLTLLNESYYKDSNGQWEKTSHSKDMVDAINRRVEYAKEHGARIATKGKNDTVIIRPLVVQLDSDSIAEHENTWMWDVIEILEKQFGKNNITGFSIHKDETNPHLHISFIPCHELEKNGEIKCAISQTKFFQNPKQLAGLHRKLRKALIDKGYDIEQENKPIEEHLAGYYDKNGVYHQKGLTIDMLKKLSDRGLQLQLGEIDMNMRKSELDKLEQAMNMVKENTKAEKEELEKQRISIENDKATVQAQLLTVTDERMKVEKLKAETEKMREEVYYTAEICSNILSEEKQLNAKFLEFLKHKDERTDSHRHDAVVKWFKKFQNKRKRKHSNDIFDFQYKTKELLESGSQVRNDRLRNRNSATGNSTDDNPLIIDIPDSGYDFIA